MVGRQISTCLNCRRQKRKCSREIPQCSLCRRSNTPCEYAVPNEAQTQQTAQLLPDRIEPRHVGNTHIQEPAQKLCIEPSQEVGNKVGASRFPALFFLDHEVFHEAQLSVTFPFSDHPNLSNDISYSLDDLCCIAAAYFNSINPWFPILCRKRFEIMLDGDQPILNPDSRLLFSAMRILSTAVEDGAAQTVVYWVVKDSIARLEVLGFLTVRLLQAAVLTALYELSHAIYPAAYLSIGKCISIAKAIGLDNRRDAPQMLRGLGSWAQKEEIRRLWWAILLLDRYIHVSFAGHSLGTDEPLPHEVLPSDDKKFEMSEFSVNEPLYLVNSQMNNAGPFTRACQAAHLLGKVVKVVNEFSRETEGRFQNGLDLHSILASLAQVTEADFQVQPEQYAVAMALVYSGQMALYEPYSCTEKNKSQHTVQELELQQISIAGLKAVAEKVFHFAIQIQDDCLAKVDSIPSLLGHCLYTACATSAWRVYEGERSSQIESYRFLRLALSRLGSRWNVGKEYVDALDKANEFMYADAPP